jgi:N-acetylglucosamine malate deacetylase 1
MLLDISMKGFMNMSKNTTKSKKVLVISAHADDHIASAGTLFKLSDEGYELNEVVLTTSGEGLDYRKQSKDYDVEKLRDTELSAASKYLGIMKTYRFNEEDLGLKYSKELVFKVVPIIRNLKPDVGIIMHSFDWHPDHRETFKIGSEAFKWAATGVQPELGDQWRCPVVLCTEGMLPVQPNILVDVTEYVEKKNKLWKIYESQARPQALNFEESMMSVRGYHLRRPGSIMAEGFSTDPTSPVILFDNDK